MIFSWKRHRSIDIISAAVNPVTQYVMESKIQTTGSVSRDLASILTYLVYIRVALDLSSFLARSYLNAINNFHQGNRRMTLDLKTRTMMDVRGKVPHQQSS